MKRATITIVGTDPLLMDAMSAETLDGLRTGKRKQVAKDRNPKDDANDKIYKNSDGHPIIPLDNMIACLVSAGRSVKHGKSKVSTLETTMLYSIMNFVPGDLVLRRGPNDPAPAEGQEESVIPTWETDTRRGVGKQASTPTAVCIVRPRFNEWATDVIIEYDEKKWDVSLILQLFREAGINQGLCSFRPNKGRGRFGRFRIVKMVQVDIPAPEHDFVFIDNGKEVDMGSFAPPVSKTPPKKKTARNRIAKPSENGEELAPATTGEGNGDGDESAEE